MQIFFSVGEPSGDQHAAHLIRELRRRRPDLEFTGYGGPLMEQAGCQIKYRLTNLAIMGVLRVIPLLWQFYKLVRDAGRYFREHRPAAVVLVDFPGFNWWIARKAKAAGIPVFYYLPPQMWAWASWRVRRMRKYVDHTLCGLPFEPAWYAERGLTAEYVGHPFFDEVADYPLDREFCRHWSGTDTKTIGILPGSRTQEVTRNWPLMVELMQRIHARHPNVQFLVACYKDKFQDYTLRTLKERQLQLPIYWFVGRTPEIIEASDFCIMASGSVSLEMLARTTPALVMYSVSRMLYTCLRPFIRVNSITLPNLISGRRLLPEWVVAWTPKRDLDEMMLVLDGWLSNPIRYRAAVEGLTELHREIVRPGATAHAAEAILQRLPGEALRKAA